MTFSHTWACSGTSLKPKPCSDNPAVFSLSLWQLTQYLSSRSALGGATVAAGRAAATRRTGGFAGVCADTKPLPPPAARTATADATHQDALILIHSLHTTFVVLILLVLARQHARLCAVFAGFFGRAPSRTAPARRA